MQQNLSKNPTRIQVFNHEQFGEIQTMLDEKGEPWFVGKDVAQALGYADLQKAIKMHVDNEDKLIRQIVVSGQNRNVFLINESGLYSLILSSKLEGARCFKRWVTSEVLPQIRQTGGYIPTRNPRTGKVLTDTEIVNTANKILKSTIARKNHPADNCFTATEIAKELGMEPNDLNHFLYDKGIIRWTGARYQLTPDYAEQGYDENRLFCYHSKEGEAKQRTYLVWTPKGREFVLRTIRRP